MTDAEPKEPECRTCGRLGDRVWIYTGGPDRDGDPEPPEWARLSRVERGGPFDPQVRRCPECGAAFRRSYQSSDHFYDGGDYLIEREKPRAADPTSPGRAGKPGGKRKRRKKPGGK